MGYLNKEEFVCLDCEMTGLDLTNDRIIEVAVCRFNFETILQEYETLIDPKMPIPSSSVEIHQITSDMVQGKPSIQQVLPEVEKMVGDYILVGHGIDMDIQMLSKSAKREGIHCTIHKNRVIDTLRLARHYGNSEVNSLQALRKHFHIEEQNAHRAMSDVIVNIEVFKKLSHEFTTTKEIFELLQKPIKLNFMPLGKYRGRRFSEIPYKHLQWASHQDFDQDLLYSIRLELKKRKKGEHFASQTNPFKFLDF